MSEVGPGVLVFAHVPPPDHGQSRMVAAMLRALEGHVRIVHVDARFSAGTEDIGSGRPGKALRVFRYMGQALAGRWQQGVRTLYYVPGPVKWSAVVRDWLILGVLRPVFPRLILHWHAIGQGEWAHGSERCRLAGPGWLDRFARRVSAVILREPELSIVVSPVSDRDARAVGSGRTEVVCNGIEDPCPGFEREQRLHREERAVELAGAGVVEIRMLYLSHGSEEKGLMDAVSALGLLLEQMRRGTRFRLAVTFAGGVAAGLATRFENAVAELLAKAGGGLLRVETHGHVDGFEKARCFQQADLFLAPSRWESFGLTVVEAMAWGVPVVAAASDGVRGVLPENHEWLAGPGDVAGLADVLGRACEALREGRGEVAGTALRRRFEDRFEAGEFCSNIRRALAPQGR